MHTYYTQYAIHMHIPVDVNLTCVCLTHVV